MTQADIIGPQDFSPRMDRVPYQDPYLGYREDQVWSIPVEDTRYYAPLITRDMQAGNPAYDEWVRFHGGTPIWDGQPPIELTERQFTAADLAGLSPTGQRLLMRDQPRLVNTPWQDPSVAFRDQFFNPGARGTALSAVSQYAPPVMYR